MHVRHTTRPVVAPLRYMRAVMRRGYTRLPQFTIAVVCMILLLAGAFAPKPGLTQADCMQFDAPSVRLPAAVVFVFLDEDGDGEKATDEPGIGDVTVSRVENGEENGTELDSRVTNGDGSAGFTECFRGAGPEFFMTIEVPEGYIHTTPTSVEIIPSEEDFSIVIEFGLVRGVYSPFLNRG